MSGHYRGELETGDRFRSVYNIGLTSITIQRYVFRQRKPYEGSRDVVNETTVEDVKVEPYVHFR